MNERMTINTEKELGDFLHEKSRTVVLFGKKDCLQCSIVETAIESIEKGYPLVSFGFTTDRDIAEKRHIDAYPVLVFYENGTEIGRLIGSGKIGRLKDILNLWFRKD